MAVVMLLLTICDDGGAMTMTMMMMITALFVCLFVFVESNPWRMHLGMYVGSARQVALMSYLGLDPLTWAYQLFNSPRPTAL